MKKGDDENTLLWHRMEVSTGTKKKISSALQFFLFQANLIPKIFFLNPNTSLIKSRKSLVKWD